MPVTARLSRKFYETFGDDIVSELVDWFNQVDATYRGDLRDLNELNFARFDAKLEQRFAEADAKLEKRFAEQDAKLEKRFAAADAKLEKRFAEQDATWERRLAQLEVKWDRRFADLEIRLSRRIYAVTVASALAQIATVLAILRFTARP